MIVSEITIGEDREIDSIKLKINDGLIEYLSNEEEVPMKGTSSFITRGLEFSMLRLCIKI
ncbi:hypothetical protein I9Y31_002886 [Clostridium perfringens]|nr:hypothetical protein [Clostridium perfringens]